MSLSEPLFIPHRALDRVQDERDAYLPPLMCSYAEKMVTEKEFDSLPPRLQEQVRRYASSAAGSGWQQYYSPPVAPTQFRRVGECMCRSAQLYPIFIYGVRRLAA